MLEDRTHPRHLILFLCSLDSSANLFDEGDALFVAMLKGHLTSRRVALAGEDPYPALETITGWKSMPSLRVVRMISSLRQMAAGLLRELELHPDRRGAYL